MQAQSLAKLSAELIQQVNGSHEPIPKFKVGILVLTNFSFPNVNCGSSL